MALGVMSFSMMGILGLLSVGLTHFQKSMDLTVRSQVTQELMFMLQRTPFKDLTSGSTIAYFYDSEGRLLSETKKSESVYTAQLAIKSAFDTATRVSPTLSYSVLPSQLKAVTITISKTSGPGVHPYEYTTYVSNTGL
jgi:uncharacterized protein (TIGR02598 family)